MNATAALALSILELAIRETPAIADDLQTLFAGKQPTPEDFARARAAIQGETYKEFVPDTDLPDNQTT